MACPVWAKGHCCLLHCGLALGVPRECFKLCYSDPKALTSENLEVLRNENLVGNERQFTIHPTCDVRFVAVA